ncbi:MAG: DUF2784 domain-containing protein [Betaproteobacteria bacterium]|nr:DUF2784 domain-containing protein [Betaproteobacteria bacterium]
MIERWAADLLLIAHAGFVVFAVLGAGLVLRWGKVAWVHVPAACWAAWIEISGGLCPLTTWENQLRAAAGQSGYPGGFVEHYLVPVLYPAGLTREWQWLLAAGVVLANAALYALVIWKRLQRVGDRR